MIPLEFNSVQNVDQELHSITENAENASQVVQFAMELELLLATVAMLDICL